MSEKEGEGSVLAFILGGLVGAGLAILFAPQSGEETREQLADWAKNAKKSGEKILREGEKFVQEGRQAFDDQGRRIRGAYDAGRKAYREGGESDAGSDS